MESLTKKAFKALRNEDLDTLNTLDINAVDDQNQNGLFYAIKAKAYDSFHYLLEKGCPVNHKNIHGETPLHLASYIGDKILVQKLLEYDGDIHLTNNKGSTPLMYASLKGAKDVVELLRESGASLEVKDSTGHNPLFYAVRSKKLKVLRYLVEHGANYHAFNDKGENLQHEVSRSGLASMQDFLYELKITPYIENIYRQTPLHLAARRGEEILVESLLGNGLRPDVEDAFSYTAYQYAKGYGEVQTMMERFHNNLEIETFYKNHLLHRALRNKSLDEAEAFIRMEKDLNTKDYFGNKPLFYILLLNDPLCLRLLLKRVKSYDSVDYYNRDAAYYAALLENKAFFELTEIKKDALNQETLSLIEASEILRPLYF